MNYIIVSKCEQVASRPVTAFVTITYPCAHTYN